MKILQSGIKTLLFLLLVSAAITSCNYKKNASVDDEKDKVADDKKEKVSDADHTFDIMLVKGSEIIEYSGSVPIDKGGAIYNDQKMPTGKDVDRNRTIMMFVGKKYNRGAAGVFGIFRVDDKWKPYTNIKRGDKNASTLSIRPKENGDEFVGVSGTLTFSDLKFVLPTPNLGGASFSLDFKGDFQKTTSKEDIYQGSGTIVISPERKMGVYNSK